MLPKVSTKSPRSALTLMWFGRTKCSSSGAAASISRAKAGRVMESGAAAGPGCTTSRRLFTVTMAASGEPLCSMLS